MSKSIVKNTLFKFILSVFNVIIPVVVGPYANWTMGESQVKIYDSATTMLQFFLIFATFGVYNYGIREVNKVRDDKEALSRLFTNLFCFGLITSVLTSIIYLLYLCFVVDASQQLVFGVMIVQILANIFMVEWLNEALENYGFITKKTMIIRIISTILLFLIVRHPEDVFLYAILMSVTVFVNNIVSFFYIKKLVKFDFSHFRLASFVKPLCIMLVIANINYLYTQLDRMFLLNIQGLDANTFYTKPSNLINMVLLVVQSFLIASVPRLSYYISHNQKGEYDALLSKSSRSYFMLVYPVCVGLFCLSYEAMYFYASPKFVDGSAPVMQIFALRCIITSVYSIFTNQIMYLHNQEKAMVKILAIGGVLNLIFDSILSITGYFTPVSAILSTALAELVMLSVMYWFIRRKMQVSFRLFSFANMKYLYFSIPFLLICYLIHQLSLGIVWTSLLSCAGCGIYYALILFFTKDDMLFYFLSKIKNKLFKK